MHQTVLGFDEEFIPQFVVNAGAVSLVQISSLSQAFVLDMPALLTKLSKNDVDLFKQKCFLNENILLVGYDLDQDIDMLTKTHPYFYDLDPR